MKIALMTLGSTGDVVPFEALGNYLVSHGHEVTVFAQSFHAPRFKDSRLGFVGYGDAEPDFIFFNKTLDRVNNTANPISKMNILLEDMYLYRGKEHFELFREATKGFDVGLVNMYDHISMEALIQNNVPWLTVDFCPALVPTRYSAPDTIPSLGTIINPLLWKISKLLFIKCDKRITSYLQSLGGKRDYVDFMATFSPNGHLYSVSRHLAQFYPDLPSNHIVTAPWQARQEIETGWKPDESLQRFFESGDKPIVISFGSMGGTEATILVSKIYDALSRIDVRAVIQSGYANLDASGSVPESFKDRVKFVGYVPHTYLFPRARMVVHHGGAGTTFSACMAGVPSVVVPFLGDQPYWAFQLKRVGIAPKPIPNNKLSGKILAQRINAVLGDPRFEAKAKALAEIIKQEDGPALTREYIEKRFGQAGR